MRRIALILTSAIAAAIVGSAPAQAAGAQRHLTAQVQGNVHVLTRVGTARVFQAGAHNSPGRQVGDALPARAARCCGSSISAETRSRPSGVRLRFAAPCARASSSG